MTETELEQELEPSQDEMLAAQQEEANEFQQRVTKLLNRIAEAEPDQAQELRDRMLIEMYLFMTDFEQHMRTMQLNGGPVAMFKALMRH